MIIFRSEGEKKKINDGRVNLEDPAGEGWWKVGESAFLTCLAGRFNLLIIIKNDLENNVEKCGSI